MTDFIMEPPTDREYTTDEDGCKRVGYVAGESEVDMASKPLPAVKEGEKVESKEDPDVELADKALQSLTLGPDPLPSDGDEDNGADFDVLPESDHAEEDASLPGAPEKPSSSSKKDIGAMEAASAAEGDLELAPLPRPKKVAKAPPSAALEALRPFLRVDPGAEDSDVAAPKPLPTDLGSLQHALKKSSSRPPSKSRGRKGPDDHQEDRSRSRASPERTKPSGALPSYLVKARNAPVLPRSQDPMPDDLSSPTLKADFLSWTLRNLCRDWREGARTWVNLHLNLYMYEPGKYLCCHPRCFAAASISADTALPERWCCWQCHLPQPDGGHYKSLWPTLSKFVWHWYECHHTEWTDAWDSVAIHLNLTCGDLAFALLGVDLHDCPLPFTDDARRALPASLPWRSGGHNPKIFGQPWCMQNEDPFTPHPPAGPPPSYLKGSATSKGKGKGKSSKDSSHFGPIRPLPSASASASGPYKSLPSLNADPSTSGVTRKSPPTAKPKASSSAQPAPVVRLQSLPGPAIVHADGSRFKMDGPVPKGFTRMGWLDPVEKWGGAIKDEISAYALPFVNMMEYSRSRPAWHLRWTEAGDLMTWLLACEEHAFYLFATKVLASLCITTPSRFSGQDRELLFVMAQVCDGDLTDELARVQRFKFADGKSLYVAAVIDHVRSILKLRVPLPEGFTFHKAPTWAVMPQQGLDPVLYKL